MKKFYVYVHTCTVNGKRYVGATTAPKPEYRWKEGRGYGGIFLQDILKYGWSSITHEVFEVESEEEMYRKEIELISFYHSNDPKFGYNCSTGGEKSASGCIRSKEYRKKMSEVCKERWSDPEYREKNVWHALLFEWCCEYGEETFEALIAKYEQPDYNSL